MDVTQVQQGFLRYYERNWEETQPERQAVTIRIFLVIGAEQPGMRAEAVTARKAHQPAFVRAYDLLVSLTKIRLPQLETLVLSPESSAATTDSGLSFIVSGADDNYQPIT